MPSLVKDGYFLEEEYLSKEICRDLLEKIAYYRAAHMLPRIYREARSRPLNYSVIDGIEIRRAIPEVFALLDRVGPLVGSNSGQPVVPLEDERVACNINITGRGGTYRWHYDRNRFTAVLYLNEVDGGETEMFPHYRLKLGSSRGSRLQRAADSALRFRPIRSVFGGRVVISPKAGRLLVMKGDVCLHSVRPVLSEHDRVNVILSYDTPGARFETAPGLDPYLYTPETPVSSDPNYIR